MSFVNFVYFSPKIRKNEKFLLFECYSFKCNVIKGRRHKRKTTQKEDDTKGRRHKRRTTQKVDDAIDSRNKRRTTQKKDDTKKLLTCFFIVQFSVKLFLFSQNHSMHQARKSN